MEIKNIYMIKFTRRENKKVTDYEFQASTENYVRIDGDKKHRMKFIGLEKEIFQKLVKDLTKLDVFNINYSEVNMPYLKEDTWSLVVCGSNDFKVVNSDEFKALYEKVFNIVKKYDLY